MSKIQEKVKDIVELRPYSSVDDFLRDPAVTLANYHFSDITAELIVKWFDVIGGHGLTGSCRALAGFRGVGKSHFMAVVSAIAAYPELRSKLDDSYVASAAQRLPRRHYPVVNVRRGKKDTLTQELIEAVCVSFDIKPGGGNLTVREILKTAKAIAADLPPVILIDTDAARPARVERNDGAVLAEIAAVAAEIGCFVGVALDDDISGADGPNSAITGGFTIDFLDQEHLYKVVSGRIFPKVQRMRGVLSGLYETIRESHPDFRWSEQRFASLYPLHPATLEIAPFVRLYVPNFAVLGFASAAVEKILTHPANSLIGLEDVFDSAETELRKAKDLESAFATYDRLSTKVIPSMPTEMSLRAHVILKSLFLLSLDGRGSGVGEITSSVILFESEKGGKVIGQVEAIINAFVHEMPESFVIRSAKDSLPIYAIRLRSDELSDVLETGLKNLPAATAEIVFLNAVKARFPDLGFVADSSDAVCEPIDLTVQWRGGLRPGRIFWNCLPVAIGDAEAGSKADWELLIALDDSGSKVKYESSSILEWRTDPLRDDERKTLLSHYLLLNDPEVRSKFGEQLATAVHANSAAVGAIVERSMLTDASLVIDGFDFNFSDAARAAGDLSGILSVMLEPLFETRFPDHPSFAKTLTPSAVSKFVSTVFGRNHDFLAPETMDLAGTFGVPLGIVRPRESGLGPCSKEELGHSDLVNRLLTLLPERPGDIASKATVSAALSEPPVGLVVEAQQLLLAAMVANGLVEFVTSKGDHINGRSLDLKVDWDHISGISLPRSATYSQEKLLRWGRLISASDAISSLDVPEERSVVLSALVDLSADWAKRNPLLMVEKVSETALTTKVWRSMSKTKANYSVMMECIEEAMVGTIDLEECLHRLCTQFGDNPEEFDSVQEAASMCEQFASSHDQRGMIKTYLALTELTTDAATEQAREGLNRALDLSLKEPNEKHNRELGYEWEKFKRAYSEHYVELHDSIARPAELKNRLDEVLRSDQWRFFQSILGVAHIRSKYSQPLREIMREMSEFKCSSDPLLTLDRVPFCECPFRISMADKLEKLPQGLSALIESASQEFDIIVSSNGDEIADVLASMRDSDNGPLIKNVKEGKSPHEFSRDELNSLVMAIAVLDDQGYFELQGSAFGLTGVFGSNSQPASADNLGSV